MDLLVVVLEEVVHVHVEEFHRLEFAGLGVLEEHGGGPVVRLVVLDLGGRASRLQWIVIGHVELEGISTLNGVGMSTGNTGIDDWVHTSSGEALAVETKNGEGSRFSCGGEDSRDGCLRETHFGEILEMFEGLKMILWLAKS